MICNDCCAIEMGPAGVVLCPLHEAAADLLAALKAMTAFWAYGMSQPEGAEISKLDLENIERLAEMAAKAIAKAEAREVRKRCRE